MEVQLMDESLLFDS